MSMEKAFPPQYGIGDLVDVGPASGPVLCMFEKSSLSAKGVFCYVYPDYRQTLMSLSGAAGKSVESFVWRVSNVTQFTGQEVVATADIWAGLFYELQKMDLGRRLLAKA